MKFTHKPMPLGIDPVTIAQGVMAAKSMYDASQREGGGGGMMQPGMGPSFQQQFTPQFSPTMQQQQDSPGGRQTATPTQYATGGQTAAPGFPGIPGPPSLMPSYPVSPQPVIQTSDEMQQYLKWGVIGLIGIMSIKAYKNKGKKRK